MSMTPYEDDPVLNDGEVEELQIVQKNELISVDENQPVAKNKGFIDTIRSLFGMKSLYLVDRFAEAKVRIEEVEHEAKLMDAKARLLEAKGNYEMKQAEAKKIIAEANQIDSETAKKEIQQKDDQLYHMVKDYDVEEAVELLQDVIDELKYKYNANVEVIPPKSIEGPD
ncbi:hypothetical protein [Gimesia fumaroli]|uniref:Uncharacterized protein n=1 Tax=Gimesia fumaroli TaxID=2527976 RepID=A0A518II79_9PLAN|nr:hypothetical protein [Gimesia fumaroli]QDV52789.1 hypothetical protein Enr17x_48570 [Gimesia fumaroli]